MIILDLAWILILELRNTGLLHLTGSGVFLEILRFVCLCFGFIVVAVFSWFLALSLCVSFAVGAALRLGFEWFWDGACGVL